MKTILIVLVAVNAICCIAGVLMAVALRAALSESARLRRQLTEYVQALADKLTVSKVDQATVDAERARWRRRNRLMRNVEVLREVRERDGDRCRHCGITVDGDRRSPHGRVYDFLDVDASDVDAASVVISCRRCNLLRDRSHREGTPS
jgi:hypothetical protein